MNHRRVERIWRREGLKVPRKQPKTGRLWLNDGSCVRLRPERRNHVRSDNVVQDRPHDGRIFRMPGSIDAVTGEALTIRRARKLTSTGVVDALTGLFILCGPPAFIRSGNGPEVIAGKVRNRIAAAGAGTVFIEPGAPRKTASRRRPDRWRAALPGARASTPGRPARRMTHLTLPEIADFNASGDAR